MSLYYETSLNGAWDLRDEFLTYPLSAAGTLAATADGWIPSPVPGDIHQGLLEAGRIKEPLLGLNSYDCAWTENRSWWYRKTFPTEPAWTQAEVVELELNGLDANAEIFLNGRHLGSHGNAFRPFVYNIQPLLTGDDDENVLLVRLSTGLETVTEADVDAPDGVRPSTEAQNGRPDRGDIRRVMVRKPQYSFGWDWSPRLATTAIAGDVKIRAMRRAAIRQVALRPQRRQDGSLVVNATLTVDRFHYYRTTPATVTLTLTDARGRRSQAASQVLLRSGYTYVDLSLPLDDPQFWWPNGLGEPHLYRVEATLDIDAASMVYPPFEWGLRFIELEDRERFALIINGRRVFCKGGNWIPADTIYARVDAERYKTLVAEARAANFNMLRIWGGGRYEDDAFYRACDRQGIMIWHDFMFACAPYPDHLPWFRAEVQREVDYQTKRLQHHACIVLWCGSNENNWGFRDWWGEKTRRGAWLYNYLLPETVRRNCPEIPYWNGSPYGGDAPNSAEVGDRHHWHDAMMHPDMARRITPEIYDECTALFVSEFGYVGACSKETTLTYLDGAPFDRKGPVWQHHNNVFEKNTVDAGIRKHYADPESLSLDEYLRYSGLCQGLMYSYAFEALRYRADCHGCLFWMYNDCWGEVGWTIVDYYLRRKIAWYFVRRAYAPLRLIARANGDQIRVAAANDTPQRQTFFLEYGYLSLDGKRRHLQATTAIVPPLSRAAICTFPRGDHSPTQGLWIAQAPERPGLAPAIFRAVDYRQLAVPPARPIIDVIEATETRCLVQVSSATYAHAIHFRLPDGVQPADNYFDLLPGEQRQVEIISREPFDPGAVELNWVNR